MIGQSGHVPSVVPGFAAVQGCFGRLAGFRSFRANGMFFIKKPKLPIKFALLLKKRLIYAIKNTDCKGINIILWQ